MAVAFGARAFARWRFRALYLAHSHHRGGAPAPPGMQNRARATGRVQNHAARGCKTAARAARGYRTRKSSRVDATWAT
jgi:hypothetical protein